MYCSCCFTIPARANESARGVLLSQKLNQLLTLAIVSFQMVQILTARSVQKAKVPNALKMCVSVPVSIRASSSD